MFSVAARDALALHYERLKRLAPLLSLGIQASTLAGVLFALVAWRGVPALSVVAFLAVIVAGAVAAAWFWYEVIGMKDSEERARIAMNPRDLGVLTPKECVLIRLLLLALAGDDGPLRAAAERGVADD